MNRVEFYRHQLGADFEHGPHRLHDAACGKRGERGLHRVDQLGHGDQSMDVGFGEVQGHELITVS